MTLFAVLGALSIAFVAGQLDAIQHAALMQFFEETGCNTTLCPRFALSEPCSGRFLTCNETNVVQLDLSVNRFTGTIPSELGELTALALLSLDDNAGLIGTIPTTFSRLSLLTNLDLSKTQLNGTIPPLTAPLAARCNFSSTFLDCASKPKSACSCSARLLGDDCENRRPIGTGSTNLSTSGATTCLGCGACEIQTDVWREWTASCTGNATISTCGLAPANTRLGIYRGACPSAATPTATTESGSEDCDNFGGCRGDQEQATLAVVSGESIIFRLGTVFGGVASGALLISCLTITTAPTTTTSAAVTTTTGAVGTTTLALSTTSTATPTSVGTTASASTTASSAIASISASAPAAAPSSGADVALIAGVVGGIAALLVSGVVVFLVCRARKAVAPNNERAPAANSELRPSNYSAIGLNLGNEYDVGDVAKLPSNQYGPVNANAGVLPAGSVQVKQAGVGTEYSAL